MIGNTGSNATREAVRATCQGFAVGMDAALHINPYYGKTSRDGLIYHFQARYYHLLRRHVAFRKLTHAYLINRLCWTMGL